MSAKYYPTLHQHLATDYDRNLTVTAGAGTGKTEVLTRRAIRILSKEKHSLDRLLVLTFTDKASVEMKERIYKAVENELAATGNVHFQKLKDNFCSNYISTFHSFCSRLLGEYPIEADIDPRFRVLDETQKVFFLRRSISRSIRNLASDKNNPDIHLLSGEFTRSAVSSFIFSIIQKREDMIPWIDRFKNLDLSEYLEFLKQYRHCILRDMSYKLYKSGELQSCLESLVELALEIPVDDSVLNRRRSNLLRLLPEFERQFEPSISGDADYSRIEELKNEIIENAKLARAPKTWTKEAYEMLKEVFKRLQYLLKPFSIEEFNISREHESYGYELLQALARLTDYCLNTYQLQKAEENYLDFQDLQLKTLNLLSGEKHKHVVEELKNRFLYIMVDEFQDTNDIQWQIIKRIAADSTETITEPRLFIVGDEKQAIYSFRGGDVRLFSKVRREIKNANLNCGFHLLPFDLKLDESMDYTDEYIKRVDNEQTERLGEILFRENFRSAEVPINFFNMFFHDLFYCKIYEEYDARPQKLLCSGNKRKGSVELLMADSGSIGDSDITSSSMNNHYKEALMIVEKIREVFTGDDEKYRYVRECAEKGLPAVAILLNRRTMLKSYEDALRLHRIDFTVVRGRGFFQRQEVVDIGNLISFLNNPLDDISLMAFLRSPAGHLSDEGVFVLTRMQEGENLFSKLSQAARGNNSRLKEALSDKDYRSVISAAQKLQRWLKLTGRLTLPRLLRCILLEGGYYASLSRGARGDQAVSNIEKLMDSIRQLSIEENIDLSDFNQWLNDRIDYVAEEGEADIDISLGGSVQIMTVHQSKGLEFPMVFVPDLGAGFNLGAKEAVHLGQVPYEMSIVEDCINRNELPEIGINAPNPENDWESEPILIKRIIKKRLCDRLIAEKKRLLYVAATRTIDHLILIGHSNFSSSVSEERVTFSPLNELNNWMDWINKILGINFNANDSHGEIEYYNDFGKPMRIPYRMFSDNREGTEEEEKYRTDF